MKIVSVDGTIIDVFGPFMATKNDSDILIKIFETTSIESMFDAGDVMLLDRGFRDCADFLQSKNLVVKMPEFIQKGTNGQLTTQQCNRSRLVTKMRYAIEVANGRMKTKWHLFGKIIPSILTPHLMTDYKIGAAILNAFAKPIICDKDDGLNIGTRMLNLVATNNELRPIINSDSFQNTRKYFQLIEPANLDFPRFNQKQLKDLSLGTYAIRQAISYVADHQKLHGQFQIFVLPKKYILAHFASIFIGENFEKPMFIFAKIKSRFRGQKTHDVYILYNSTAVISGKLFYICECQHGLRTVGCCSHVMAIIWYFGYGQYEVAKDPASHLNDFFIDTV